MTERRETNSRMAALHIHLFPWFGFIQHFLLVLALAVSPSTIILEEQQRKSRAALTCNPADPFLSKPRDQFSGTLDK